MDTLAHDRPPTAADAGPEIGDSAPPPPRRPRRRFLDRRSATLGALVTCAIGFYAGIRVEKAQLSSSSTTTGAAAAAGSGRRAGLAALFARAGRGTAGAGGAGGAAGAAGAAFGAAGGSASFGTVAGVNGSTVDLTEASGNTIRVRLSKATKITKTQSARRSAIRPGDTIIVSGIPGAGATVDAASVTDSGSRSTGSTSSGTTASSGSSPGAGSAVGSLFSPGG